MPHLQFHILVEAARLPSRFSNNVEAARTVLQWLVRYSDDFVQLVEAHIRVRYWVLDLHSYVLYYVALWSLEGRLYCEICLSQGKGQRLVWWLPGLVIRSEDIQSLRWKTALLGRSTARVLVEAIVGGDLSLLALVQSMVRSEEAWKAATSFSEAVMLGKEEAGRLRERQISSPRRRRRNRRRRPGRRETHSDPRPP